MHFARRISRTTLTVDQPHLDHHRDPHVLPLVYRYLSLLPLLAFNPIHHHHNLLPDMAPFTHAPQGALCLDASADAIQARLKHFDVALHG